ncbi:MAG TPA: sigma 54-interacting transcriptional regulator [Thermoanaerobacterales bacterium]|nr:sigma 54-interacting transcriptional regulator [Thermoanaerobacterales bacterium]
MDFYSKIPDLMDEGIIAIDSEGYIKIYNRMAKNIFGINFNEGPSYPEGVIKDGDIVVVADNMLGADDGGMTPEDLKLIGVNPCGVELGYAVVAVGRKGDKTGQGYVKFLKPDQMANELLLKTSVDDIVIESHINFPRRILRIKINDKIYDYEYIWAAGHMVILDGSTKCVKFYQSKGYTSRKEDMKFILMGQPFKGKGRYSKVFETYNKHILELHSDSEVVRKLLNVACGKEDDIKGVESLINGIPVRCSIKAVTDGAERIGAILEIVDITELKAMQIEREEALITLKKLQDKMISEKYKRQAFKAIIGQSPKIKQVIEIAKKAAEANSTVLLLGESGTGKNLFAEAIHKASSRRNGPFIYINCASIPENLLESELFGHEKGSFTGAVSEKKGKFEMANGGTIFLDEINELPVTLQAKILHVLQSKSFTRVGGLKSIDVDIRIIAASNKDLEQLVSQGKFRGDLFYRINVISITLPPLRERKEDIYLLIENICNKLEDKINKRKKLSHEVYNILYNYEWPGNIRELENVLERAMLMSGDIIQPGDLPEYILRGNNGNIHGKALVDVKDLGPMRDIVEEAEKRALLKALKITKGNGKKAMELLQIGKTNFYEKLKKFGIESSKFRNNSS